jgi:hypothetical protein
VALFGLKSTEKNLTKKWGEVCILSQKPLYSQVAFPSKMRIVEELYPDKKKLAKVLKER